MSIIPNPKYMAIVSVAMGISALIQNVIRAVTLLVLPSKTNLGVVIYYAVSALILVLASTMYFIERSNYFA